jgi:hypothetical protein
MIYVRRKIDEGGSGAPGLSRKHLCEVVALEVRARLLDRGREETTLGLERHRKWIAEIRDRLQRVRDKARMDLRKLRMSAVVFEDCLQVREGLLEVTERTTAEANASADGPTIDTERVKAHRCRDVRNRLKPYATVRGC